MLSTTLSDASTAFHPTFGGNKQTRLLTRRLQIARFKVNPPPPVCFAGPDRKNNSAPSSFRLTTCNDLINKSNPIELKDQLDSRPMMNEKSRNIVLLRNQPTIKRQSDPSFKVPAKNTTKIQNGKKIKQQQNQTKSIAI